MLFRWMDSAQTSMDQALHRRTQQQPTPRGCVCVGGIGLWQQKIWEQPDRDGAWAPHRKLGLKLEVDK